MVKMFKGVIRLAVLAILCQGVCWAGEADDDWNEEKDGRQIFFPSDSEDSTPECEGAEMTLRAGEATIAKSHRHYGERAYENDYRCKWLIRPVKCDLNVVCRLRTREGIGSGGRCAKSDYLRIMKGQGRRVMFQKKYCGTQTASIKFTGDEEVKIVFQARGGNDLIADLYGMSCKIVCVASSSSLHIKETTTAGPSTTTISAATTTTARTTTTPEPTTSTSPDITTSFRSCECGELSTKARIICPDGRNCTAAAASIPWQAGLLLSGRDKPFCGGTLINSLHVLTAAHCLEKPQRQVPSNLFVMLGDYDWTQTGEADNIRFGVSDVILHPEFRVGAHFNNDLAIVRLNRPVNFQLLPHIRPVCLPANAWEDFTGTWAEVSGWGVTDISVSSQATVLQTVDVKVMEQSECASKYSPGHVTENMLCAAAHGADACYGDSGGPCTVRDSDGRSVLAGVVSWGLECGKPQWPGVYARVTKGLDWIRRNSQQGETCDHRTNNRDGTEKANNKVHFRDNRGDRRAG